MTKQLRIAHILPWPNVGGTEHATLRIARAIDPARFASIAFCDRAAPSVGQFFDSAGVETAGFDLVEPSYRRPSAFLRASWRLAGEFRARRIDLVHCADMPAAHYAAVAGRLARLPVLSHIRNSWADISTRDKSFLLAVNRFAFVSQASRREFGFRAGAARGCVVYDGIAIPDAGACQPEARERLRRQWGIPPATAVVSMVARVARQKDHATLIRAAARVAGVCPDVRFLIVGEYSDRPYFAELASLLDSLKLAASFVFTGFQSDVNSLIDLSDMVVLSTHTEGLPLVILEAMAYGKPVVATAVGGVPEGVIEGQTGFLVPHEDEACLAERIVHLLRNPAEASAMGQAAREVCRAKFSVQQFGAAMSRLYEAML